MKEEFPSIAKITCPKVKGISPRERLFDLLDTSKDQPVTWVSGPAGSGKTTLVASYLIERKLPCIWYQVDERDEDLASFFYYIGFAAKKAYPHRRKPLPRLTSEYLSGIPTFTQRFFDHLYSWLSPPFFLIFDDYHRVALDSPLHEVLLNAIYNLPEGVKVILISRREPPSVFSRLYAHDQVKWIGWDEIRFTLEESRNLIVSRISTLRSKEGIERLHQIADGWVAGLILISDALRRGIDLQSFEKSSPQEIMNYFGNELFNKTKRELQIFLMRTASLPSMTTKMAHAVSGFPDSGNFLETLTRNNYFMVKHYHTEPVYQYHPLFRNFLITHAKDFFSRKKLTDLYHRAAMLLEESGLLEEAAQIYVDQKNWEGLILLTMKHAPFLIDQGRNQTLEKWLISIPQSLFEHHPWLLYWLGTCRFPYDLSSSQNYLKKAYATFRKEEDIEGTFLSWSGIVDGIAFSHNDLYRLDHWIRTLEDLMNEIKEFPSQEIGARVASSMVSAMALRWPHHPGFYKWAEKSLAITEPPQMVNIRAWLLFNLFLREFAMGEFEKGASIHNQLSPLTKSREVSPFIKMIGKLTDAIYYQVTGAHEKCIEAVSEGMELSRTTGIHILDQPFLVHALLSGINVNDLETAREFFNKLGSSLNLPPSSSDLLDLRNRYIYHFSSARYALVSENLGQFNHHMALAFKYGDEMGSPVFQGGDHLLNAVALHRFGKNKEAMEELEKGSLIAQETQSKLLLFNSLLSKAFFSFEKGEEASGLQSLKRALRIGKDQRFLNTHFDDPKVTASLCMKALEAGIEIDYVQEIIRRRRFIPDQDPFQLENWPWPLKIYSLGRFDILRNGKPIRFSRKAKEKPLFMLKALIALGGRGVREEVLSDILWPEADGDAAHHAFETTLHRLRMLIDYPQALQLHEGRLTLNSKYCWVDAWAFERLLGEVDTKEWRGDSVPIAEKAIKMYGGAFLAKEIEHPWLISMRERLRSKFLRSVNHLGNYWCQTQQWGRALECYQRGLEVDDLAEEFCQGGMVCYQNLGLNANALSLYNRFEKRVKAVLGIDPSSKTKALRDALLKNLNNA